MLVLSQDQFYERNVMNLLDLYESVAGCPNTAKECPGIVNSPKSGIPPRGFYTRGTSNSVQVLIVGKNPGHVLEHEKSLYINRTHRQIAESSLEFAGQAFAACHTPESKSNRSFTFHRNLI